MPPWRMDFVFCCITQSKKVLIPAFVCVSGLGDIRIIPSITLNSDFVTNRKSATFIVLIPFQSPDPNRRLLVHGIIIMNTKSSLILTNFRRSLGYCFSNLKYNRSFIHATKSTSIKQPPGNKTPNAHWIINRLETIYPDKFQLSFL